MKSHEIEALLERADRKMKETNGHSFETILKTRCLFCGRSPKQKGTCRAWFTRFIECLTDELLAPTKEDN